MRLFAIFFSVISSSSPIAHYMGNKDDACPKLEGFIEIGEILGDGFGGLSGAWPKNAPDDPNSLAFVKTSIVSVGGVFRL